MTKGYGFTIEDIDWSCPADLEPYAKAYKFKMQQYDSMMHTMGLYNEIAYEVVMARFGAGLAGKKSSAKYIEKPFMELQEENRPLTEEETQREVDRFFAAERARRINWKRSQKAKNIIQEE